MRTIFSKASKPQSDEQALMCLSKKQNVLFLCDCALEMLPLFQKRYPTKLIRESIKTTINFENCTTKQLEELRASICLFGVNVASDIPLKLSPASVVAWVIRTAITQFDYAWSARIAVNDFARLGISWDWIYDLYTNALKKQSFTKTSDIQGLIQDIKDNRDFTLMPILFDALEDQGLTIDRKKPWGLSHWVLN